MRGRLAGSGNRPRGMRQEDEVLEKMRVVPQGKEAPVGKLRTVS